MSPIRLDPAERATLEKLINLNGICERQQISSVHAQKFIQLGFLLETSNSYHFTLKGQLEVLRQNFHLLPASKRSITISGPKGTLLNARLFGLPGTAIDIKHHEKWDETPGAFEEAMSAAQVSKDNLIAWCRHKLAQCNHLKNIFFSELSVKTQQLW